MGKEGAVINTTRWPRTYTKHSNKRLLSAPPSQSQSPKSHTMKIQFDSQFVGQSSENESNVFEDGGTTFWTFCPYCFNMYQFSRVYEGCCLRCQNQTCRRPFHGIPLDSLPKMELEKGVYSGCFGYFPLGFSPEIGEKLDSWSPIAGMIPVRRNGEIRAGGIDLNDNVSGRNHFDYSNAAGSPETSDEINDESGVNNLGDAWAKKQKTMAWNARGRKRNAENYEEGYGDGFQDVNGCVGDGNDDMAFFEENGEIFVGLGPDVMECGD